MGIDIQHVLAAFQGSLGLNMRIMREIYGVTSLELVPRKNSLLSATGPDGVTLAPLRLNCDNAISPYTLLTSSWQPEEFSFVQRTTANLPAFTLIDVGANVGLFSRQCLARLSNCNKVFAYEPDTQNFSLLEFNLAVFPGVQCCKLALSDNDGSSQYYLDPDNSGNYSLNAAAMPEAHTVGVLNCVDVNVEARRWSDDGLPIFYKSDTQGFDEKIAARIDSSFWSRVVGGIFEVWQIKKPEFDKAKFRAVLDSFPNKCFLTDPHTILTTDAVMDFAAGSDGKSGDLGFWR